MQSTQLGRTASGKATPIACLVALLLLVAVSVAAAATPLPARSDRLIYDTAGVIDDDAERQLELRHRELLAKADVAIVIVTVPRLVDETIDELAVRVGQGWGVGQKGQDRGLVVALARDDRKIFVATGYGTEGYLPDGRIGGFLDEHALPHLRRDRFGDGVVELSNALVAASAREYGVTLAGAAPVVQREDAPPGGVGGVLRIVLLVLAMVGFFLLARRHPFLAMMLLATMGRRGGGGGFGGGMGSSGFGGGGFGGGGAGRGF